MMKILKFRNSKKIVLIDNFALTKFLPLNLFRKNLQKKNWQKIFPTSPATSKTSTSSTKLLIKMRTTLKNWNLKLLSSTKTLTFFVVSLSQLPTLRSKLNFNICPSLTKNFSFSFKTQNLAAIICKNFCLTLKNFPTTSKWLLLITKSKTKQKIKFALSILM